MIGKMIGNDRIWLIFSENDRRSDLAHIFENDRRSDLAHQKSDRSKLCKIGHILQNFWEIAS